MAETNAEGLRARLQNSPSQSQQTSSASVARETVMAMNSEEARDTPDDRSKKTYGRTPDGTGAHMFDSNLHPSSV